VARRRLDGHRGGAYFDCWRYDLHVVEPFEVPAHWARFRSMDWGSAKPFSVGWWAIVSDDYYAPRAEGGPDRLLPRGCSCGTASGMAPLDSITTVLIPHCANQLASRCKSPVNVPNEKDARAARPAGATRLISLARPKRFQVLRRRPFPTWRREFKAASSGSRLIRPPKMIAPSRSGSPRLLDRGAQSRSRFP
jgi:hypothetical protein